MQNKVENTWKISSDLSLPPQYIGKLYSYISNINLISDAIET